MSSSSRRGAVRSAADRASSLYDWRTAVMIALLLFCSATQWVIVGVLSSSSSSGGSDRDLALVTGVIWSAGTVYVCLRRHLGVTEAAVIASVTILMLLVMGSSEDSEALRSMTTAGMTTVPVAAVMWFRRRGVLAFTAAAMAADGMIVYQMSAPLALRLLTASATVTMVALPILVVLALLARVEGARDVARRLASTDQLTGLLNRRGMREEFGAALAAAARSGQVLTVMVADIDHFKRVNDTHGHDAGDQVLVAVARAMEGNTREGDLLVRLGGEELAWVSAFSAPRDADHAAERTRAAVAAVDLPGLPRVSVSIGVATSAAGGTQDVEDALSAVLLRADRALYAAKAAGRDRVVRSGQEPAPSQLPADLAGSAPTLPA